MKIVIYSILLSLPINMAAQYSYFNNLYEPPDSETQNVSVLFNLFALENSLWCMGVATADSIYGQMMLNVNEENGEVIGQYFVPLGDVQPSYTWGDTYCQSNDGTFVGTYPTRYNDGNYWPVYFFGAEENGSFVVEETFESLSNDSTDCKPVLVRQMQDGGFLICGTVVHVVPGPNDIGLFFVGISIDNQDSQSVEIPLWNEEWQSQLPHEQVFPTDMLELPNGNILVSGVWGDEIPPPFKRTPFIMQFTSDLELISNVEFGNPEVDNWYPWMDLRDDGKVMFAYAHGIEWDEEIDTYAIWDMRLGMYDPAVMDTMWIQSYPHEGIIQRLQDFEPTADGGYILLAQGVTPGENGNGEVPLYLLKVDSEFEEEWFQTYEAPQYSWDITAHDLEVTSDGGYAILSQFMDMEDTELPYYKTWLLKLDACGDLVWSGCPYVGIDENKSVSFSIFPNPTNHSIQLQSSEIIHDISMTDISGRHVFAQLIMSESKEIDLSELSSGVYLLQATYMDGKTEVVRVVRE